MHSLGQNRIKGLSLHSDGERYFLIRFGAPPGTKHHPQEIRLNPTHSIESKVATKITMTSCKISNGSAVRLINNNRLLVKLGQDMPPSPWPSPELSGI